MAWVFIFLTLINEDILIVRMMTWIVRSFVSVVRQRRLSIHVHPSSHHFPNIISRSLPSSSTITTAAIRVLPTTRYNMPIKFGITGVRSFSAFDDNKGGGEPFYGSPRTVEKEIDLHPPPDPSTFSGGLRIAIGSAFTALSNPERGDAVAALGDVTGRFALARMYERMRSHPVGERILIERPHVANKSIDFERLSSLPEGSFGREYAAFMAIHGFDPEGRSDARYVVDPDLAYVMLRYRQCHDFWHTLTGLPPTVPGELGLKWLELMQTGLPVAALSVTVGSLQLNAEDRQIVNGLYLPWAVRVSSKATFLMNVYYEEEFETDIDELRKRLGVDIAPKNSP